MSNKSAIGNAVYKYATSLICKLGCGREAISFLYIFFKHKIIYKYPFI